MSIKLCQAAGSTVTPLDDARLYSWIANRTVGIVTGCDVEIAGTNQLSIASGWGICQGHVFTISAETIAALLPTSGTVSGRLLIHIDTSDTDTPVAFVTQASGTLPDLTQEDIDGSGSIYEIPLETYSAGTLSISGLTHVAPSATDLLSAFLLAAHPVGSLYESTVSTDPSTLFGGTWARIKDRFVLAAGDTYTAGATGGEATHTLTVNEMPQHMHDGQSNWIDYVQMGGTGNNRMAYCVGGGASPAAGGFTHVTGGNWAHNNMPPYLVVYMWQRTA